MGLGEWERMLPEPNLLGKYFYEQYKIFPDQPKYVFIIYFIFDLFH